MTSDEGTAFIVGCVIGFLMGCFFITYLLRDNPTIHNNWYCSDWQIVADKPECHVMTLKGQG